MNIEKIMNPEPIFKIANKIPITESIIMMWLIMAVIIIFAYVFTRNLKTFEG